MRDKKHSSGISIFIGLIFIFIGAIWILHELDIFNMPLYLIWISIGKLWPLILIAIGICIIFRSKIITFIVAVLYLAVIVLGALGLNGTIDFPFIEKTSYYQNNNGANNAEQIKMLEDTTRAELNLTVGLAEDTEIGSTDTDYLIDLKTNADPVIKESDSNETQTVSINTEYKKINNSYFNLNKNVVWDIHIKSGASEINLNLQDLNVASINFDSGASDIKGTLSSKAKRTDIIINSGASDIEFKIPEGSGCEVVSSSAATSIKIDNTKLSGIGKKTYRSENFDTADTVFYFDISSGASDIKISYY